MVVFEADDLIFSKILEPLLESSSHNPVVNQSPQLLSYEDDKNLLVKWPRNYVNIVHSIYFSFFSFVGFHMN